MGVKNYKCISCGSEITFQPTKQNWKCDSCNNTFSKKELDMFFTNKDDDLEEKEDISKLDFSNIKESNDYSQNFVSYNCENCGGEIVADDTVSATFCLYCKSSSIIKGKLSGDFRPEFLLPFSITDEDAKAKYAKWMKKKLFVPKIYKNIKTFEEIKGIYAPFFLYDFKLNGSYSFEGKIITSWSDSNYDYTKTEIYHLYRNGNNEYKRVPVDSSTKLNDELMTLIEPYDYEAMQDFSMSYMSGFFAERYDVSREECYDVAKQKALSAFETRIKETCDRYTSVTVRSRNVDSEVGHISYALLPVYYLKNIFKNKGYEFIVNGQTGHISGKPPFSIWLFLKWMIIFSLGINVIISMGGVFLD